MQTPDRTETRFRIRSTVHRTWTVLSTHDNLAIMDEQLDSWLDWAADMGMLRRLPIQERSRAKMMSIIDSAEALLREVGYDHTTRTPAVILERAKVTGGSFYTYFDSVQAVIETLSLRQIGLVRAIINRVAERSYGSWEETSDAVIDAYTALFWPDAAVRELWLNAHLSPAAQAADQENDRYVARRIRDMMTPFCGPGVSPGTELQYHLLVVMHDHWMRLAFRMDERGDPEAIAQLKAASRAYLATFLPHVEAPAGGGSRPRPHQGRASLVRHRLR